MTNYRMLHPKDRIRQMAVDMAATADNSHLEPPVKQINRPASLIDVGMQLRIASRQAQRDKELASKYGLQRFFDNERDCYFLQPIPTEINFISSSFHTFKN